MADDLPIIQRKNADGTWSAPLTDPARLVGWTNDDPPQPMWEPLLGVNLGGTYVPAPPLAPSLSGAHTSQTVVDLAWTPANNSGRPVVTAWAIQRRRSLDNGTTWEAWADLASVDDAVLTYSNTALTVGTPEIMREYRVRGVNADGDGAWSNTVTVQWNVVIANPPTAPTALAVGSVTATGATISWAASNDSTVTSQIVRVGNTVTATLGPAIRSYTFTDLGAGTTRSTITVSRVNSAGESPRSNAVSFTTTTGGSRVTMMMGCSDSPNDHGGTEEWDGWRTYTRGPMLSRANRTGAERPKFLAYSEDGPNLGFNTQGNRTMTDAQIKQHVIDELNNFYYNNTASTRSARWGIKLFWSNGNENQDKGAITEPHTATKIANYVGTQRALWEGVHTLNTDGSRRFPDAYAGSNPVHEAEMNGIIADWLHPSAQWHDFVMWSSYPPGRQTTESNPTYNWPSKNLADRTNRQLGFMARCFYRTIQAQAQARIDSGDPTRRLMICVGEIGIGDNPADSTTRPYYAVHGLAARWWEMAQENDLDTPFMCWWDQQKKNDDGTWAVAPENLLGEGRDSAGTLNRGEPLTTNPRTVTVWQNWQAYHHGYGGVHPASWAGNPKSSWKTTGTVV